MVYFLYNPRYLYISIQNCTNVIDFKTKFISCIAITINSIPFTLYTYNKSKHKYVSFFKEFLQLKLRKAA